MDRKNLLLYLVTDSVMAGDRLEEIVSLALANGVTMVQLREKQATFEEFCNKALKIKKICDNYYVPLIINDNVDVCLAVDASGVHLGHSDCDVQFARKLLGENKIIGASCRSVDIARQAQLSGADYLGVGAVFGTNTKLDAKTIEISLLKEITNSVSIPVVAIGGIDQSNIIKLQGNNIAGVAVVSSIIKAKDVAFATKTLAELANNVIN